MNTVLITGNTYPVKEQLKSLGGRWNKPAQGWNVPAENAEQARALVASAGPDSRPARTRFIVTRFSSGESITTNANGRCIDAPCCGCCS